MKQLKPDEVIATKAASNIRGIEKLLHKRYSKKRIPQSEYFRLNEAEVIEAASLLRDIKTETEGASSCSDEELEIISELEKSWIPTTRFSANTVEKLETLEEILFDAFSTDVLYNSGYDTYTKIKGSHLEIIMSTDNEDPDIKIPVSKELREACYRRLSREDLFTEIANAQDDDEAETLALEMLLDFSLVYCWGYRQGMFNFIPVDEDGASTDYSSLIESLITEMENRLIENNRWYTVAPSPAASPPTPMILLPNQAPPQSLRFRTSSTSPQEREIGSSKQNTNNTANNYWALIIVFIFGSFIYPQLGIPILCLLLLFKKQIINRLKR